MAHGTAGPDGPGALTRRPAARRCAGRWRRPASPPARPDRRRRARSRARGRGCESNGSTERHRVAQRRERLGDPRRVARLQADLDRRREVRGRLDEPARRRDRGRDVDAAVDQGRHELGVDLRLGVAAHRPGDDPRPGLAVTEQHPGEQRVERPLARREDVRVVRVEAEVRAAVLVVRCPVAGSTTPDPKPEVVRFDQADRVARPRRRSRGRSCRRPAGSSPRAGRGGAPRVDPRGELGGVGRVEQALDRDVADVRVGQRARRGRPSPAWPPRCRGGSRPGRSRRPARTPTAAAARTGPGSTAARGRRPRSCSADAS